jgi:type IV secretory pathway VirB2 component (pilin)
MSHKSRQFLLQACKILIVVSCLGYISWRLGSGQFDWAATQYLLSSLPEFLYVVLPALSIASWLVESYKWQLLVHGLVGLRFRESVIQNLTANAASFLTPLRAGEFAAKAAYYQSHVRKKNLERVLIGNLSQMTVTVALGITGIAMLMTQWEFAVIWMAVFGLILFVAPYLWRARQRFLKMYQSVIIISFIRYLLFGGCWVTLLSLFTSAGLLIILGTVTAMYLIVSLIPAMQFFDLFLKWSVASFFIGYLDITLELMSVIVGIIWLFNQVLPVLLGCGLLIIYRHPKVILI